MNIRKQLLLEHSKENTLRIVAYIITNPVYFDELMNFVFSDESKLVQRASHALSILSDKNPGLILPYSTKLVEALEKPDLNKTLKRNIVRVLQFVEIPEKLRVSLINSLFSFVEDPKEAIAVKAFSMTVLYNLTEDFPELRLELKATIEHVLERSEVSPGVRSRANKILAMLSFIDKRG